ncbi:CHASE3 domain-containing protein [Streptomyces sp. NPDC001255]|uniref:CHASE3 domain-containing protein n=1 Tax=Streptomyces sp. NPDC001255 TaxID=3364550 RepID=UPI0036BB205E
MTQGHSAPPRAGRTGRLSVQGWMNLVLGILGVLLVLAAVLVAAQISRTNDRTSDLVDRIQPARSASFRLQKALLDQETAVRGYALTGDESFLAPYTQGRKDEKRYGDGAAALLAEYPKPVADLKDLRAAAARWRAGTAEPVMDRVRDGAPVPSGTLDSSKTEFDHIRELFNVQIAHLDEVRDKANDELDAAKRLRDGTFLGILVVLFAGGGVLAVLLRRIVGRPLTSLERDAQLVRAGDFERPIDIDGPSDVRALGLAVEDMRRKIVAELSESRSREALLAERTAELDAQTNELQRSNAELEQFAYVASHDLQEPLRKVASFCQLLEKRYGDQLDGRGKQYIDFAVDGAKRMQVLINDLLAFSRVGRMGGDLVEMPLGETLDRALSDLEVPIEEAGAAVEIEGELPRVLGDRTTLTMLWQNLLGNAVKFRHPERTPRVRVTSVREGDRWHFSVTDNGIGVPEEFGEKVFVIFQRLHSREEYGGTGIGLALCRKIVEHHGGQIGLDHSVAEGARVRFTLPALPDSPPAGESPADIPAQSPEPQSSAPLGAAK